MKQRDVSRTTVGALTRRMGELERQVAMLKNAKTPTIPSRFSDDPYATGAVGGDFRDDFALLDAVPGQLIQSHDTGVLYHHVRYRDIDGVAGGDVWEKVTDSHWAGDRGYLEMDQTVAPAGSWTQLTTGGGGGAGAVAPAVSSVWTYDSVTHELVADMPTGDSVFSSPIHEGFRALIWGRAYWYSTVPARAIRVAQYQNDGTYVQGAPAGDDSAEVYPEEAVAAGGSHFQRFFRVVEFENPGGRLRLEYQLGGAVNVRVKADCFAFYLGTLQT